MVQDEIKPSDPNVHSKETKHAGNKIHNTLQKMFHVDNIEKAKHQNDSKASYIICNESEAENHSKASSIKSSDTYHSSRASNSITAQQQNVRFRKNADGSHVHCLQPSKRTHRLPNFLRELGIIHHVPSSSESSLLEKYGKPQEIIGKGAFGIVRVAHKAVPKVHGEKLFAVKEFKKRHNEPPKKYIKRLTSEFCISSSLHHINVINTLDLLQDTQGNYCEVMEYCPGGDLYSLITSCGSLEQEEAGCFFGQLINGVKYLHDNGVAHRECFRMAWETQVHLSHGISGSEPYIAPEEFIEDWFDPRLVDVWACGIIYMAMITGQHLWRIAKDAEDPNYHAYLEAKKHGKALTVFQRLTDNRRRIMSKIIEPNPKERYTTGQIVRDPCFLTKAATRDASSVNKVDIVQ
ncbi:9879_t:CDS:2 [Entrophospora sp. SA101]|nr:1465_t:CDS:2 [Entrophospora sp. SA101]CAJ0828056.1 9879_t:CDS:2 [Entrophospora sp. SA101]